MKPRRFARTRTDVGSVLFTGITGFATFLILALLAVILAYLLLQGGSQVSWRFVTGGTDADMFDTRKAGIFPMLVGTTARVVLIASGNAAALSPSLLEPVRTLTATIAAELGETVVGGHHYRMLFVLGTLLFGVTFLTNLAGDVVIHRLKRSLEGAK